MKLLKITKTVFKTFSYACGLAAIFTMVTQPKALRGVWANADEVIEAAKQ